MTPAQFIAKWSDATLREHQGSQEHFIDLCRLLDQPTPAEDDPHGERYCFERGATKAGGGDGWADVWRRGCFAWEYKGRHKDLDAAFRQLAIYTSALENPPYLVTCDMVRIVVRTNFTNTITQLHEFSLEDLREPAKLDLLRQVFEGAETLKPVISPQELTAKAVERFAELGRRLQERKDAEGEPLHDPRAIAHFLNQLVFCMFAEDARLLPEKLFTKTVRGVQNRPARAQAALTDLFAAMASENEDDRYLVGIGVINWFNGGLFDGAEPLLLEPGDLKLIADTADEHDWSEIDPAIFGTMFEEALKATRKRAALGAHYTDREKILKIVDPVIVRPLQAEWAEARAEIEAAAADARAAEDKRKAVFEAAAEALKAGDAKAGEAARRKAVTAADKERAAAQARAKDRLDAFLARLAGYRVLDPACGSGNFLYVALHALKDLELAALIEAERLTGLQSPPPRVGLDCVRGIEIERYAAELARVTLWIGDLQWSLKNGYRTWPQPILSTLDHIENRDALLNEDGTEAEWPAVDAIVGNPPFLGDRKIVTELGLEYAERLRKTFAVGGSVDFVCYWFDKSTTEIDRRPVTRVGLVSTNSIRGGVNRRVLERVRQNSQIWEAWSDEPWVLEGAAVRVSMVCFGGAEPVSKLDGHVVQEIHSDLTASSSDLTKAKALAENHRVGFNGVQKTGPFEISADQARRWLTVRGNPNSRPNSDVLKPYWNGLDVTRRPRESWIIDFTGLSESEAALYEAPFQYALLNVEPARRASRVQNTKAREQLAEQWWLFWRPRPEMTSARAAFDRTIVTPEVAKHRVFSFAPKSVGIDKNLIAIAREDGTTFGVLHSRFHELWSLRMGSSLEDRPRYTPSTTFETFPFPEGLTPNIPAADYADNSRAIAIAEAARELNEKRDAWLNPPDLVRIEPEVVPGYPDRVLPRDEDAAKVLKTRTLTNLYNQRPAWLDMAHKKLDAAVAAAYGWPADLSDEDVLEKLFALNQERAAAGR